MKVMWTERGWNDYLFWQSDPQMLARLNVLIKELRRHPFKGTGKPEPLRRELSGWWSRRLSHEHRIVYRVMGKGDDQVVEISACRHHYDR